MPTQIPSLQRYQRSRRSGRFEDLPPSQCALAEAHYQRLIARWGNDLPQWRRAILVGRAKDLVLRPRDGAWARALRRCHPARSVAAPTAGRSGTRASSPSCTSALPISPAVATGVVAILPGPPVRSVHVKPASIPRAPTDSPTVRASPLPAPGPFRLDVRGISLSGTNGRESADRILRDLDSQCFWRSPGFTILVRGHDLPRRWAWHLIVEPVP